MFHRDGRVRSAYRALHSAIAPTAPTDLAVRAEALDRAYLDRGITFSLSGQERPIPLDIVLRVIVAAEWGALQRGIVQRVRGPGGAPRARAVRPADGRRPRGGPRPLLPRQRRLHSHPGRRAAGGRHLPTDRRRVPRATCPA